MLYQLLLPFPTTGFAIVSGALFGPWLGLLIAVFGVNLTAWISFGLARFFFGQHFVQEKEKGWVKELDHLLTAEGFIPVMLMRLLFVPSDFVSLGSGLTRMPFKTFLMATFVGTLPATIVFTLLGEAVLNPAGKLLLASLAIALLATILILRRVPALKSIFRNSIHMSFELFGRTKQGRTGMLKSPACRFSDAVFHAYRHQGRGKNTFIF
ncbi:MAG: VTT domain-containing protein [Candidatus Nomurabacteria bacterium]|nr:MAG: VTT domain-containing protein [Candidatus Nomurabacteria bacterium]